VNHRPVTRVPEFRIDIVANKIEKGRELGKSAPLGLKFSAFGELVHDVQNIINRQLSDMLRWIADISHRALWQEFFIL